MNGAHGMNDLDDETLSLYVAGALPPKEAAAIADRVAVDAALAERVAEESTLLAALMEAGPGAQPPVFWADMTDGIMARIEAAEADASHARAPAATSAFGARAPRERGGAAMGRGAPRPPARPQRPWLNPALGGLVAAAAALLLWVRPAADPGAMTPVASLAPSASAAAQLGAELAGFEGITLESLLGSASASGAQGLALALETDDDLSGLDLDLEPIEILAAEDPETVGELSADELNTLIAALDQAMKG